MKSAHLLISFLLLSLLSLTSYGQRIVTVYGYHTEAPFVINSERQTGLNFEFVDKLNELSPPEYTFQLRMLQRPALNQRLLAAKPSIILWTNPAWFKSKQSASYHWSNTVFLDSDVVVSLAAAPVNYQGPESLTGMVLGARSGYYYSGLNPLISAHKLRRVDAPDDQTNLQRLLDRSTDVMIISKSTLVHYARSKNLISTLHMSSTPQSRYERKVLVTDQLASVLPVINNAVDQLNADQGWQSRLSLYSLWPGPSD